MISFVFSSNKHEYVRINLFLPINQTRMSKVTDIASLRVEYSLKRFDKKDAAPNPITQFQNWLQEAIYADTIEPNAMTLATVNSEGQPKARIVLLKGVDDRGFIFYTNYNSDKGKQLEINPKASIVFCWLELQRQVRVEGIVSKISKAESELYFQSRPRTSQLGAHASPQSKIIENRGVLENNLNAAKERFLNESIPIPETWGGYVLKPWLIEFWQGRESRLHDRIRYILLNESWQIHRLAP
jgi:pyridoxamine 5'-phosphate oxidase